MIMAELIVCEGIITKTAEGAALCSTGWVSQLAPISFDPSQIDPTLATSMFGAGFGLFIVPWAAAWGVSQMLRLLR